MGIIRGLMGHASQVDLADVQKEFEPILIEGEQLAAAFKLVRDMFVFTTMRLILVDKQGLTGSKTDYMSIPYRSIERFSKESTGLLDLDAELKIWIRGSAQPIQKAFKGNQSVNEVYKVLSEAVLRQ
jgi:hypothetical protein